MSKIKTPETLTASQRAADLGIPIPGYKSDAVMTAKPTNIKQLEQARSVLNLGLPTLRSAGPMPNMDPNGDPNDSFMLLSITDIEPYRLNPRTDPNPLYEEIKASIRADGITNILTVTRRPGAAKYHPYGGGNTRLAIATELYQEGDQRFAKLNVVCKAWRGDANVLSAHISENENRGDVSFWNKAYGVNNFKIACEQELGRLLTTTELSKELKNHGINYGIRVVQNFFFAIEHLAPVGPWLQASAVNTAIRPFITGVYEIAKKLDRAQQVQDCVAEVLGRYRADLSALEARNVELDFAERQPALLDVATLIVDIQAAIAGVLRVTVDQIGLMMSAFQADSRISKEDLTTIQARSKGPVKAGAPGNSPQAPVQAPLVGMLGVAKKAATPAAEPNRPHVVHEPTARPSATDSALPVAAHRIKDLPAHVAPDSALAPILSLLLEISDLVMLSDVLLCLPELMPFGYLVDMPADLQKVESHVVPEPSLRAATWKFLAALSYQLDPRWFQLIDPQQSTWAHLISQGATAFMEQYGLVFSARTDEFGNPEMGLNEVAALFGQPDLGYLLISLLRAMEQLRLNHPERFVPPTSAMPG